MISDQDDRYPTSFLVALAVVAIGVIVVALFLWFRRPPDAGRRAVVPAVTSTIEVEPVTPTARPVLRVEGAATPAPTTRPTASVEVTSSPTVKIASSTPRPAPTTTAVAQATHTLAASPTVSPVATGTIAVVMPPEVPAETRDAGTIEGQVALQGRDRLAGITLLVNGTPAATTDASGRFHLTVPAGRYTVQAGYSGYITIEAPDVEVRPGEVTRLPAASLGAGDTDGDGDVDLFDVVRCIISLGQTPSAGNTHADVNGDGIVDFRDVILTQGNYRGTSPAPWR